MPRSIKIVIAVCAGLVLAVLLAPQVLSIRSGAAWIPSTPPAEDRRVVHPKGFSIIPPPGWVVRVTSDAILLGPGSKGMRYTPGLSIGTFESAVSPDLSKFHETTFRQLKAYEMTLPVSGGGDVPYLRYHLFVRDDGHWYELLYVLPNGSFDKPARSKVPETMMLYIQSLMPSPNKSADA